MSTFIHIIDAGGHDLYVPISQDVHWGTDTGTSVDLLDVSPETTIWVDGSQWWYMNDYADVPYAWGAMAGQLVGNAFRAVDGSLWLYGHAIWPYNLDPTVPITYPHYDEKDMRWAMKWDPATERPVPIWWVPEPVDLGDGSMFSRDNYSGGIISACDRLDGPGIYAVVHGIWNQRPMIVYYPGTGQTATTGATAPESFYLSTGSMDLAGYPVGHGDVYSYTTLVPADDVGVPFPRPTAAYPRWEGGPITIFTHAGAYYCLASGDFLFPNDVGSEFMGYDPIRFDVQAIWRCTTDPTDPYAWTLIQLLSGYDLNDWYGSRSASPAKYFGLDWSWFNDQVDLWWAQPFNGKIYLSYAHTTSTQPGYARAYDLANTTGIWVLNGAGTVAASYDLAFSPGERFRMAGPLAVLNGVLYALEWDLTNNYNSAAVATLRLLRLESGGGWTLINQFTQTLGVWGSYMWAGFWGHDGKLWMATDRSQGYNMQPYDLPYGMLTNFRIWRCDPLTIGPTAAWDLWMDQPMPIDPYDGNQHSSRIATRPFLGE